MQLAQSTSLPAESNLAALLFPSATLSAGPTPATMACGVGFEGGFDTLLPEGPNLPAASVCPAAELPIDLRGGVPLAFMAGAPKSVESEVIAGRPGLTLPISGLVEEVEPLEGDAPVDATKIGPRASQRSARLTAQRLGPDREIDMPVDSSPHRVADVVAVTQLGFVSVAPIETPLLGDELIAETPDETPLEDSGTEEEDFVQWGGSAWSEPRPLAGAPTRAGSVKRLSAEAADVQPPPAFEPRHPISSPAALSPALSDASEKISSLRLESSPLSAGPVEGNTAETGQISVTSEEQSAAGLAFADPDLKRGLNLPRRGWEKTAATPYPVDLEQSGQDSDSGKTFVTSDEELFTPRRSLTGTEVAKPEPIMPAPHFSSPTQQLKNDAAPAPIAAPSGLAERVESHNVLALALDGVSSAHEAVEVVLRTADRLSSLVHKSVRLEFAVGGEKLDVRVELRANEVLTTFHTESAELRTALASEWQGVTASAGQGERTLRILPAQFGSSEQNAANSFSGDASSRHREPQHQAQPDTSHAFGSGVRGRSGRDSGAAVETPAFATAFAAPGTALHLHTLA